MVKTTDIIGFLKFKAQKRLFFSFEWSQMDGIYVIEIEFGLEMFLHYGTNIMQHVPLFGESV